MSAFSASGAGPSKKAPKWPPGALPRSLPGPPGDLLAGPRQPKEAPRAAQEPPRPPQEPPRSAPRAVLAAIWRPTAPQRPPGGYLGLLGARFSTLQGPIFDASAASSAAFREALSLASRPLESTAPEAKKVSKCQNQEPANTSESRHVRKCEDKDPANRGDPITLRRTSGSSNRWSAVSRLLLKDFQRILARL